MLIRGERNEAEDKKDILIIMQYSDMIRIRSFLTDF